MYTYKYHGSKISHIRSNNKENCGDNKKKRKNSFHDRVYLKKT